MSKSLTALQYSKALGNTHPKSVVHLETVIWQQIFSIACGKVEVYGAVQSIAAAVPEILAQLEEGDENWFNLGLFSMPSCLPSIHLSIQSIPRTTNKVICHPFALTRLRFHHTGPGLPG